MFHLHVGDLGQPDVDVLVQQDDPDHRDDHVHQDDPDHQTIDETVPIDTTSLAAVVTNPHRIEISENQGLQLTADVHHIAIQVRDLAEIEIRPLHRLR